MPRILIAECKQEVSSFNPVPSHYEDFFVLSGGDMLGFHRSRRLETGGALSVFKLDPDVDVVPTYSARARTSAGTLAQKDFDRIARRARDLVALCRAAGLSPRELSSLLESTWKENPDEG